MEPVTRQVPDTMRRRFRDRESIDAEREIRRIREMRARCPRAAALLDEIAPSVEAGMAPMHLDLAWFFLDSRVERGAELTPEQEAQVRQSLGKEHDGH